ncbi:unnamed protein product [Larinioides sclopetarius]|uniref:Uncharacterized protein n=1 Tax=Larinioides sclopetarius TaxID=280406 RepID=A0AAV2A0G8_9ARAC
MIQVILGKRLQKQFAIHINTNWYCLKDLL